MYNVNQVVCITNRGEDSYFRITKCYQEEVKVTLFGMVKYLPGKYFTEMEPITEEEYTKCIMLQELTG